MDAEQTLPEPRSNFYCPKCGDWHEVDGATMPDLLPGTQRMACASCRTVWRVETQFYEEAS